jgi:peptide/nickel transport system permease protein
MGSYILRRLLQSVVVIIGVTLVTFLALHAGGDPTYLFVSERASFEEIEATRRALGFDRPLHEQYLSYVGDLVRGDFGQSLSYRQPAMDIVLEALPATMELALFSMLIAIVVAIPLGVLSAIHRGTAWDGSITTFAMFGQSIPNFWMGIMMILFFGLYLRWFPISGHVPFITPLLDGDIGTAFANLPRTILHLILPGIAIGTYSLARNTRLIRSSLLEVLEQDYVRTARSKGLSERRVLVHHALRNAWLPVVTIIGLEFGFLLGGVVVVETVFSYPGIGRLLFAAINQRDIPLVQAGVTLLAGVFILLNLVVDLVYVRLDLTVTGLEDATASSETSLRRAVRIMVAARWPIVAVLFLVATAIAAAFGPVLAPFDRGRMPSAETSCHGSSTEPVSRSWWDLRRSRWAGPWGSWRDSSRGTSEDGWTT